MICRRHVQGKGDKTTYRRAIYSNCEKYRYALQIRWNFLDQGRYLNFLMLNPSTATELANDPTVEGCERRAMEWGYAGVTITNIFAYRATDPGEMKAQADPVGAWNDKTIFDEARYSGMVVCAWGNHGEHLGRGEAVSKMLTDFGVTLHALKVNKSGHPQHPLYVARAVKPEVWVPSFGE